MDTFIEYIISKKKTYVDALKTIGIIIGAIAICFVLGFCVAISKSWLFMLWFALGVAVWYGVYILISRMNVEYEYIFTNGELDIDAIYSKKRRVHILSVRAKEFSICAPAYDERYKDSYLDVKNIKKYYYTCADMNSGNLYFADFLQNAERVRLYFQPPLKMVEAMRRFNIKNIHIIGE